MNRQNIKIKLKNFLSSELVKGALFLCVCVFICKIIGVIYRIPLVSIIGANGVGVYQLIFPIYSFLLILSSNALPVAISKIVASKLQQNNFAYIKVLKNTCFYVFGSISFIFTLIVILFCQQLSILQGNQSAYLGYICVAPSIFFVCLISVYRGLFQGVKDMKPTGISQIIEQVVKFVFGLGLPFLFMYKGVIFQVAMATLSVTISEIVAFIYLYVKNKTSKNLSTIFKSVGAQEYKAISKKEVTFNLLKVSLPIMLSNCVLPLCVLVESFLVVNILKTTMGQTLATEIYGVYSGVVCVLVNAPIMLCSSIGIAIVPYLQGEQNGEPLKHSYLLTLLIAFPSALFFECFSSFIIGLLFPNLNEYLHYIASSMLVISSINVITLSFSYILIYYLQAKSHLYKPAVCLLVMNSIRLIAGCLCLSNFGIIFYVGISAFVNFMQMLQLFLLKKQY